MAVVETSIAIIRRLIIVCILLSYTFAISGVLAQTSKFHETSTLPRHPLERQALSKPREVLDKLQPLMEQARIENDQPELSLLYLAQANACRVIADWNCQRTAGLQARLVADQASLPIHAIRGTILEARASLHLQDYPAGEQLLGNAELRLRQTPSNELMAEVFLAYSSMSNRLGKYSASIDYAERGLALLGNDIDIPSQVRLLRTRANSLVELRRLIEARQSVKTALEKMEGIDDPKLLAELYISSARIAGAVGNYQSQQEFARKIIKLSESLKNTQLNGLGVETLGDAAYNDGEIERARAYFEQSIEQFQQLGLSRDELRVTRRLVEASRNHPSLDSAVERWLLLDREVTLSDRAQASDSFDKHIRYTEQEASIQQLRAEAALARERVQAQNEQVVQQRWLFASAMGLLVILGAFFYSQRRMNAKLQESLAMRQRALVQTSHELRNPISGVLGLSELLLKTNLPSRERGMIEAIRHAGASIGKLAQDLLDSSRLESGKMTLQAQPASLGLVLDALRQLHRLRANEKGLGFAVDVVGMLPPSLSFDADRLQQVLTNLLSNSLKFTDYGRVDLGVMVRPTNVSGSWRISFEVKDTGPGLSKEELNELFKPFSQGQAGARHKSGAGLGLAISHELVALMGGKLEVESQPGRGARFFFDLTLNEVSESSKAVFPVNHNETSTDRLSVLHIDDDAGMSLMMANQLELLGCDVDSASNGAQAKLKVKSKRYDVILTDLQLPDCSGLDLIAGLRRAQRDFDGALRVAIVSGEDAPDVLPTGVDQWLTKPVTLARLMLLMASVRPERSLPTDA